MSMSKETIQKQINIDGLPVQFRQPFEYALTSGRLLLLTLGITDSELIKYVIPFLQENPSITMLNVQDNKISWKGALALSFIKTLTELHIGNNHIGDIGAEFLAESKTLKVVDAWSNGISDRGAIAFSKNITVESLNLFHNNISKDGAFALSKNESLTILSVMQNPIGVGKYNLLLVNQDRQKTYDKSKYALLSVMTKTTLPVPAIRTQHGSTHVMEKKEIAKEIGKCKYMESTNQQKSKSLLFKYANASLNMKGARLGIDGNRLDEGVAKRILSYLKPKPLNVKI